MNSRTKLALIQNAFIGIPVIIAISLFNAIFASASALDHTLGSAIVGFGVSLRAWPIALANCGILLAPKRKTPTVASRTHTIGSSNDISGA